MIKLALVERDPASFAKWKNLERNKKFPNLSVIEIMTRYEGFMGEVLDFLEVNEFDKNLEKRIYELLELQKLVSSVLLFVISAPDKMPKYLENRAIKLGYDVGDFIEQVDDIYCSIFQEILFGFIEELVAFKDVLNEYFLFPDRITAEKYVTVHNEMSKQGRGVEDYMPMVIYEIWKYNEN